jgi:hypothetical protein
VDHHCPNAPFQQAIGRSPKFFLAGEFIQLTHIAVRQFDEREQLPNGFLAAVDLFAGCHTPTRVPIQVDGNGHARLTGRRKEPLVSAMQHRLGEPDVGAQQVIGSGEQGQVEHLE